MFRLATPGIANGYGMAFTRAAHESACRSEVTPFVILLRDEFNGSAYLCPTFHGCEAGQWLENGGGVMTALNFAHRTEDCSHAASLGRSRAACPDRSPVAVVRLKRALWAPVSLELRLAIEALLRRGERRVLLDLRDLTRIDAAGTGELARAFTAVRAAGGSLEIAHASDRVRRVLSIVGLLALLSGDPEG